MVISGGDDCCAVPRSPVRTRTTNRANATDVNRRMDVLHHGRPRVKPACRTLNCWEGRMLSQQMSLHVRKTRILARSALFSTDFLRDERRGEGGGPAFFGTWRRLGLGTS